MQATHFVEEIALWPLPGSRGIGTAHTQRTDAIGLLKPLGGAEAILSGRVHGRECDTDQATVGQEDVISICDRQMVWIELTSPSRITDHGQYRHSMNIAALFSPSSTPVASMDIRGLNGFAPVLGCTTLAHKDLFGLVSNPTLLCANGGAEKILLQYSNESHKREMINSVRFMYSETKQRLSVFVAVQNGDFLLVELDTPKGSSGQLFPNATGNTIQVDPDRVLPAGKKNNCTRLFSLGQTAMNDFAVHRYLDGSGVVLGVSDSDQLVVVRLKAPTEKDASSFEVLDKAHLDTNTLLSKAASGCVKKLSGDPVNGDEIGGFFTYVSFSTDGKKFAASADKDKFVAVFGYKHLDSGETNLPLSECVHCLHIISTVNQPYRLVALSTSAFACCAGSMLHFVDVPAIDLSECAVGSGEEDMLGGGEELQTTEDGILLPKYSLGDLVDTTFSIPEESMASSPENNNTFIGLDADLQTGLLVASTEKAICFFRIMAGKSGQGCTLKREAAQWLVHKARITEEECHQVPLRLLDDSLRCRGGHFLHYFHYSDDEQSGGVLCSHCKKNPRQDTEGGGGSSECLACPQCDVRYCRLCSFVVQRQS